MFCLKKVGNDSYLERRGRGRVVIILDHFNLPEYFIAYTWYLHINVSLQFKGRISIHLFI